MTHVLNKDRHTIMNGYQSYLRRMMNVIDDEVELSKKMGFNLGIKLVRGAYMSEERELAAKAGKPSPVWDTIEETHHSYNSNLKTIMGALDGNSLILVASHNADTVDLAM
jgi:proline dehydrogenase